MLIITDQYYQQFNLKHDCNYNDNWPHSCYFYFLSIVIYWEHDILVSEK